MKSKEFFQLFVADLTELEMADLLESCIGVIEREHWKELRKQVLVDSDRIEDLEYENGSLEDKIEKLEDQISDYQTEIVTAIKALEDSNPEEAKQILTARI